MRWPAFCSVRASRESRCGSIAAIRGRRLPTRGVEVVERAGCLGRRLFSQRVNAQVGCQPIRPVLQGILLLVAFSLCAMFKNVRNRLLVFPGITTVLIAAILKLLLWALPHRVRLDRHSCGRAVEGHGSAVHDG